MPKSASANVKVDLAPLEKGIVECAAAIQFDTLEQPDEIRLTIRELSEDQMKVFCAEKLAVTNVFKTPKITGTFDAGGAFEANLDFIKGVEFAAGDQVNVWCYVGNFTSTPSELPEGIGSWVFRLANFRLSSGDIFTALPPPLNPLDQRKLEEYRAAIEEWRKQFGKHELTKQELQQKYPDSSFKLKSGGMRRNRVAFDFAGRRWCLDDDLHGRWPGELDKISEPILSGTLSTERKRGDSPKELQQIADDITELLTFALARDIKWAKFGGCDADGKSASSYYRVPAILSFNQSGSALADNWEQGNVKQFLENGANVISSDRDWWSVTIGLITQSRATKEITVKCSLLNTLLDRISTKVIGDNYGNEIDPNLEKHLDRKWFRCFLHALLRTLSSKWTRVRSDKVCGVITEWNSEPSFPVKIIRACEMTGMAAPTKKILGFRHKLIHEGEFNRKLKTIDDKIDYLFRIEAIVSLLLIRLLGFTGYIYLQANGMDYLSVDSLLKGD